MTQFLTTPLDRHGVVNYSAIQYFLKLETSLSNKQAMLFK